MASSLLLEGGNGNNNNNNNNSNGNGNGNGGSCSGGNGGSGNSTSASGSGNSSSNVATTDDNKSAKYSMHNNNNNNNNNGDDTQSQNDEAEIRLKRQTLAQRKVELEMLLNEKSWMLQQIQKQEAQILSGGGNYEYMNFNEILSNLAKQYKQEQLQQQQHQHQHHHQQHTLQHHHSTTGSTAILRRKTATGAMGMSASCKDTQNILNNNNNNISSNNNRKSEVSNRSSEYDNYPVGAGVSTGAASSSSCGNLTIDTGSHMNINILQQQHQQHQQMPMKQTMSAAKKRTTSTTATTPAATNYGSYLQQLQQQQQLLQQQQQQQLLASNDQLYLQQYLAEQNYLQQKITSYQQRQQHQQQQLVQQLQQQQQHSNFALAHHDVISLYSVNSANVATLRQQNVAPQQQPQQSTIVQCDKYYLSPTHQSHSNASGCSFIKSSQNIKKYNSPAASPTAICSNSIANIAGGMNNTNHLGSTMALGVSYDLQHHPTSPSSSSSSAAISQQQQQAHHPTLQHHYHHVAAAVSMPSTQQLDAISLAPSYAVSMDAAIGGNAPTMQHHNMRWRSHTNIPTTTSPLISPTTATTSHQPQQQQQQHYHSHLGVDIATKSHSSDMLAHISPTTPIISASTASINSLSTIGGGSSAAYYGTIASLATQQQQQQKGKPLDEISISSLNSGESQKKQSTTVKPKQWLESSLDGPIIRSTPTTEFIEHASNVIRPATQNQNQHQNLHKTSAAHAQQQAHAKHKLSSQSMSVASSGGLVAGSQSVGGGSSTTGASRHYSMSKHSTSAQRQALQDDAARYAKLSQSTSYLHSLESNNNDGQQLHHHHQQQQQHNTPLAYQYLPPKPTQAITVTTAAAQAALQPTPPPRPPPALDKSVAAPVAPALVAAAVANSNANNVANSSNNQTSNNALLGPDIRIESPKNMTVIQQATFQPYKEVTKPFEMADFYKYSTKFRQKENTPTNTTAGGSAITDGGIE